MRTAGAAYFDVTVSSLGRWLRLTSSDGSKKHQEVTHNVKHEEGGGYRQNCAFVEGRQAVGDRCHGVFPNAVMNVASFVATIDATCCLKLRLIGSLSAFHLALRRKRLHSRFESPPFPSISC